MSRTEFMICYVFSLIGTAVYFKIRDEYLKLKQTKESE